MTEYLTDDTLYCSSCGYTLKRKQQVCPECGEMSDAIAAGWPRHLAVNFSKIFLVYAIGQVGFVLSLSAWLASAWAVYFRVLPERMSQLLLSVVVLTLGGLALLLGSLHTPHSPPVPKRRVTTLWIARSASATSAGCALALLLWSVFDAATVHVFQVLTVAIITALDMAAVLLCIGIAQSMRFTILPVAYDPRFRQYIIILSLGLILVFIGLAALIFAKLFPNHDFYHFAISFGIAVTILGAAVAYPMIARCILLLADSSRAIRRTFASAQ